MHSLSEEDRKLYWDDGIHFTPKGYERFGELIFEVIKDSL
jgi:lysophospholipase L1-like esterase